MAYDEKTNREAVRAYSHPGVSEYIPRRRDSGKDRKAKKPSLASKIKRLFGIR
jgi:hypothetical protein